MILLCDFQHSSYFPDQLGSSRCPCRNDPFHFFLVLLLFAQNLEPLKQRLAQVVHATGERLGFVNESLLAGNVMKDVFRIISKDIQGTYAVVVIDKLPQRQLWRCESSMSDEFSQHSLS